MEAFHDLETTSRILCRQKRSRKFSPTLHGFIGLGNECESWTATRNSRKTRSFVGGNPLLFQHCFNFLGGNGCKRENDGATLDRSRNSSRIFGDKHKRGTRRRLFDDFEECVHPRFVQSIRMRDVGNHLFRNGWSHRKTLTKCANLLYRDLNLPLFGFELHKIRMRRKRCLSGEFEKCANISLSNRSLS